MRKVFIKLRLENFYFPYFLTVLCLITQPPPKFQLPLNFCYISSTQLFPKISKRTNKTKNSSGNHDDDPKLKHCTFVTPTDYKNLG